MTFANHNCWATIAGDVLVVDSYPLPPSHRELGPRDITEICVGWFPPTVRLTTGEFAAVDARQARELAGWAERHGVAFVRRVDVWSLLLEPFLDTEFSATDQARTLQVLHANGMDANQVEELRREVERPMLALTALTWEWCHYGLFDVLAAMQVPLLLHPERYRMFVERAMQIADLGAVQAADSAAFVASFPPPTPDGPP